MLIVGALAALAAAGAALGLDTYNPLELGVVELRRLGVTSREGIVVTHVYAMSPADRAGMREGDVLLRLDGVALNTREDMSAVLERHSPQDRVAVEYIRGGRGQSVDVVLGSPAELFVKACEARDPEGCFAAGNRLREGRIVPRDGVKAVTYYEDACPGVERRPPIPAPAAASTGDGVACQGSYSLGGGSFSFSKAVATALECAEAAAEHARTICRIKKLGTDSAALGQWSFRQGTTSAIRGFTTTCP